MTISVIIVSHMAHLILYTRLDTNTTIMLLCYYILGFLFISLVPLVVPTLYSSIAINIGVPKTRSIISRKSVLIEAVI